MPRVWVCLVLLLLPSSANGQQDEHDTGLWLQAVVTVGISENWRLHLEEQQRWFDNVSAPFETITRAAVGRRVHERATLWGGYGWIAKPPGPGIAHEHRIWQQLSATFPGVERWTPSLRLRLEQRFQDNWSDSSHRLRAMGRFVRPLTRDRRWSLAAWNEWFVTLDETPTGPRQGYNQNRLFGGLLRQFNPSVGLEFGYLWVNTNQPAVASPQTHVAFVWLNLTP
jgi:hypothetical protein